MARFIKIFIALIVLHFFVGCSTTEKNEVKVHGEIEHLGKSEIYISYFKGENQLAFDTIHSNTSGKFDFRLKTYDEITPITLYFHNNNCWTTLFAKNGDKIKITGKIELVDLLKISGGKVNNDLARFKEQIRPLYIERQMILDGKYLKGGEEREIRLAEINLSLKRKAKEFILANPSSIASVVLIQDFFYQDYDPSTKELLSFLKDDAAEFHMTKKIREGITKW